MALKNVLLILVLTCFVAYASATRNNDLKFFRAPASSPAESPEASRAQFIDCWKALQKLRSCANLTLYFLTGKAELISECCSAIETSKSKCSFSDFTPFTGQEGDILSAYCAALAPVPAPSPA